jgi:hypothetical protein
MYDDGQHMDGAANDNIYGAKISFQSQGDIVKYYVKARNATAMALEPQRAEYEFLSYGVGTTGIAGEIFPSFSLFPNPASTKIHLDAGEGRYFDTAVEILSLQGKRVFQSKPRGISRYWNLDLPVLPPGVYLLTMEGKLPQRVMIQ